MSNDVFGEWVIQNINEPNLFWSNTYAWTTLEWADTFSESERMRVNLPFGGEWITKESVNVR
jgi:hypothetical protein